MDACCVLQTVCWINGEPRADLVRCFGTKHQRVVRSTAPHLSPSLAMRAVTSRVAMRRKRRREDLVYSPRESCECTLNECVAALKWTTVLGQGVRQRSSRAWHGVFTAPLRAQMPNK